MCVRTAGRACVPTAGCGLHAEPVRGYRRVIDGAGLSRRVITLPAGGDGRPSGVPVRGLARPAGHPALAPAVLLAASGRGRGRIRHGTADRTCARVLWRRPGCGSPGAADEPDEELIGAHEADCGPGRDHRPDGAVGPALGHVRGERGRDSQPEQPAGQAGYRHPVPGRVQDDHRTGVDQAVARGRRSRAVIPLSPWARTTA